MLYAIVAIIALIIDQAVKYWTTTHIVLMTGTKKFIRIAQIFSFVQTV